MDVVLVSIAGLSLFLAIAMGVVLFTVLRDDRRRSDARVAVLTGAAAEFEAQHAARSRVIDGEPVQPVTTAGTLFAVEHGPSPWGRRLAVAAGLALAIAGTTYVVRQGAAGPAPGGGTAAPLELLTLTHTQQPSGLMITGTVYNPRGASPVSQVFAAAVLFGPDGAVVTSGRAPIDFTTLAPGQESPFVISVPAAAAVARYRVGFRAADGRVISHVDRRVDGSAAQHSAAGRAPWGQ